MRRTAQTSAGTVGATAIVTMDVVYMLVIGAVVGVAARWIMPGKDPGGLVLTVALGVAGSMVGAFIGRQIHWVASSQGAVFAASVIGALILLAGFRLVTGMRRMGTRAS